MKNPKSDTLDFLLQTDVIEELLPTIGEKQWQVLHLNADSDPHRFGMWSALLDKKAVKKAMTNDSWDLHRGDGKPGFMQSWSKGKKVTNWLKYEMSESGRLRRWNFQLPTFSVQKRASNGSWNIFIRTG